MKYEGNTTFIGDTLYEHSFGYNSGIGCLSIYNKNEPPDPFNLFEYRYANKQKIITNYSQNSKEEIYIGLYKLNEFNGEYEYLPNSFYDKTKQTYYPHQNQYSPPYLFLSNSYLFLSISDS